MTDEVADQLLIKLQKDLPRLKAEGPIQILCPNGEIIDLTYEDAKQMLDDMRFILKTKRLMTHPPKDGLL